MGQSISEYVEEVRVVITVAVRNEVFRHVPVFAFIFWLILGISKWHWILGSRRFRGKPGTVQRYYLSCGDFDGF